MKTIRLSDSAIREIDELFHQKLRDAVAEVTSEAPPNQDWSRIVEMSHQYGGFLELFPEAVAIASKTPPKKTPAKKAAAKKAPAKKAAVPQK